MMRTQKRMNIMKNVSILALGTAVPKPTYFQEEIIKQYIEIFNIPPEKRSVIERIYNNSSIIKRHSVIDDFQKPRTEWKFWGSNYPHTVPSMSQRTLVYKEEAPKLSLQATRQTLEKWGGNLSELTHLIFVSCTGTIAPGVEYYLMQELGLSPTINRLGINFMGCFGAFKGLSVARAFALENPRHRILLVCTELCSLHLQADQEEEIYIGNSLFSDGSATAILGVDPKETETPVWETVKTHSLGLNNCLDKMSWEASDRGFLMRLSHKVPVYLGRHIKEFVTALLPDNLSIDACDWAIHPGGKSILQAIEKALQLKSDQTQSSWETLAQYGNMSSATFLFVLDHLSQQKRRPWAAGLAFGPGLSVEGLLLRSPQPTSSS